jgi:hypothetical protein
LNDQQQASQTCLLELLLMNQGASFPWGTADEDQMKA